MTYACNVDPMQEDRATEIKMCNFSRPHMRAFHFAWFGFFMAFFIWFSIAPIMSEIKITLKLNKQQIWTSNIIGVGGTIFMRFLLGPICDKYGARIPFAGVLMFAAIPTAMTGLVQNPTQLYILRLFIGSAGATFVMCQYWCTRMFAKEVVGTANAVAGGWGNLGGGVTQLVVGTFLFPLFKSVIYDDDAEKAWRTVCAIPAVVTFATGVAMYFFSEDSPKGNYGEMKKNGNMAEVSAAGSFRAGALNLNTWVLFIQYACCFGVELTMNNAAALYFKEEFKQTTENAAAIASLFGWMNLFARGLGGYFSDKMNDRMGMRGRLYIHTFALLAEGIMVIIFANSNSLAGSIVILVVFSTFVQMAEGTSFGIVPYIDPPSTGTISGIIGAGGNVGAVCFGLCFRQLSYLDAFYIMGGCIIASSLMSLLVFIPGHRGIVTGEDDPSKQTFKSSKTLEVPVEDAEEAGMIEVDEEVEHKA
jgi:MFS transporter, NNP family, nitrate/nitrite transporter